MHIIRIVVICILALCASTGVYAQTEKKTAMAQVVPWKQLSEHIWVKTVPQGTSGLTEVITLTDTGTELLFEARSVCPNDSRLVVYTWSHKDHSAVGISCHQVLRLPSTRIWSDVVHPLPEGVWRTWVYHEGKLSKR